VPAEPLALAETGETGEAGKERAKGSDGKIFWRLLELSDAGRSWGRELQPRAAVEQRSSSLPTSASYPVMHKASV